MQSVSSLLPPASTRGPERARASDKRLEAVGMVIGLSSVDSGQPRVDSLPPLLAVAVLKHAGSWRERSSFKKEFLRSRQLMALIRDGRWVTYNSCVQWLDASMPGTVMRAADVVASARGARGAISRCGKGVKTLTSV